MTIAVLGCGTVGKNVVRLAEEAGYDVRYILELPQRCVGPKMVSDPQILLTDPQVSVVVDVLPGVHPSLELMRRALTAGKHVVTSNKAALAAGMEELMLLAAEHGVCLRYEASCGGTIPVISAAEELSATNTITSCSGIMNGTTNYILDSMQRFGMEFQEALDQARALGYAEADPSADLSGFDVKNKLRILSSTAYHGTVPADFPVTGIEGLSAAFMRELAEDGNTVKLLGISVRNGNRVAMGVCPVILSLQSAEAGVPENYNLFTFEADHAGQIRLYGQGAGGVPTADAVMRDLARIRSGCHNTLALDRDLVYDPSLLSGSGRIGGRTAEGSLSELTRAAAEAGEVFAFQPDL